MLLTDDDVEKARAQTRSLIRWHMGLTTLLAIYESLLILCC